MGVVLGVNHQCDGFGLKLRQQQDCSVVDVSQQKEVPDLVEVKSYEVCKETKQQVEQAGDRASEGVGQVVVQDKESGQERLKVAEPKAATSPTLLPQRPLRVPSLLPTAGRTRAGP